MAGLSHPHTNVGVEVLSCPGDGESDLGAEVAALVNKIGEELEFLVLDVA